jgi:sugar phosphate isomerase/epimerase
MSLLSLSVALAGTVWAADEGKPAKAPWAFFAFEDGLDTVPLLEQPKVLKELGYDGISYTGAQRIGELLQALDAQGLKMFNTYIGATVEAGKPPYEPGLKQAIEQLKGRDSLIWLYIQGPQAASEALDERAVAICREVADMAAAAGLRVALYPHTGFYVSRIEDALRIAKKTDRKNLGVTFNLCHFLKMENEKDIERRLTEAIPWLFAVSINGADSGDTNKMEWSRLIQTLDRGSFDVAGLLKTLKRLGYTGPIGLQCWAIPGDSRENLTRSMAAWQKLCVQVGQ